MNLTSNVNCHHQLIGNNHYFFNTALAPNGQSEFFNAHFWQSQDAITGTAQGRGTTWFIKNNQQNWVLKHYFRGGLVGKILKDSYLFTGLEKTRSVAEFALLMALKKMELPAPAPVGCAVYKKGLTYQADILTTRVNNAQDLVGLLSEQKLDNTLWHKIGATIAQFHRQGVYHDDLNIHNILVDQQENVWLIDFDQGKILTPNIRWQQANLDRLERSFFKEQGRLSEFHWQPSEFAQLLRGYNTSI